MKKDFKIILPFSVFVLLMLFVPNLLAYTVAELSSESKKCIDCHMREDPAIYGQWGTSKHFRANVGCYECHKAEKGDKDAYEHEGSVISIIVSPRDCARCHEKEVAEFSKSHHAKGGKILDSLDNILAEVVEGNRGFKSPAFPKGNSASAVTGCWQCHGSPVKVLPNGKLDPATWPNTGIGRINPDGSEGACTACHTRHGFSAAQGRYPDTCGKCHMGPDHPQLEIFNESKHGIAFHANEDALNLDNPKWILGEDYTAAPTCASCHMSATPNQPVTHDIGMRISWNNRPETSIRPEASDKKLGLKTSEIGWKVRRENMKDVCLNCHNVDWVDNFYVQYDEFIKLYNDKFAKPGIELMGLAKSLMKKTKFSNKIDFTWFELWHHEGRRARHGASMMGPDYAHWHGMYEVSRNFYHQFIPEIEELIEKGKQSKKAETVAAAKKLEQKLDEILKSDNHKWFQRK